MSFRCLCCFWRISFSTLGSCNFFALNLGASKTDICIWKLIWNTLATPYGNGDQGWKVKASPHDTSIFEASRNVSNYWRECVALFWFFSTENLKLCLNAAVRYHSKGYNYGMNKFIHQILTVFENIDRIEEFSIQKHFLTKLHQNASGMDNGSVWEILCILNITLL